MGKEGWKVGLGKEELGTILEVHGVVVIPSPTPDEAMLLEDIDDLLGNLVFISYSVHLSRTPIRPLPVVGIFGADVNGDAVAVSALSFRTAHRPPIEGRRLVEIFSQFGIA